MADQAPGDGRLPEALLERYFNLHDPAIRTERLRERILSEQQNLSKQDAVFDLLRSKPGFEEGRAALLDIGAGIGSVAYRARQRGFKAYGVEPSLDQVKIFYEYIDLDGIHITNAAGEHLPFRDNTFDFIISMSVLEHCRDVEAFLREALRVLKPGGCFYLVFPNYNFPWEPHYDMFWLPYLPRWMNKFYLRLRGRDPSYLDTLHLVTPAMVKRILEKENAIIEDASKQRYLERLNDPGLIGVPTLSKMVAFLNRLGLKPLLSYLVGLGLYYPVIMMISKGHNVKIRRDT